MPRLFIGLEIPAPVAQRLQFVSGGLDGARWVEPSDYHVTLRFVGDIDDRTADEVAHGLGTVDRRAFEMRLSGLDAFGKDKPSSVYARVVPDQALVDLQADIERAMRRLGLMPEVRRFIPHVTLARLRDTRARTVADWLALRGAFATEPFAVGRFVLYSSRASTGGGPYLVEEAYPLRRAAAPSVRPASVQ